MSNATNPPSTEVIIATYNKPELRLVLEGLCGQTDSDFSVVVADDGSGPEIAEMVATYQKRLPRLRHVWHEDLGFRKTRILNEAVRTSPADYLVFVDADCIPEPHFIADHKDHARPGEFVAGRRVYLGPEMSTALIRGELPLSHAFNRARLLMLQLRGKVTHARCAMRLPRAIVQARRHGPAALKGANMAMWRADLLRINGFDNDFTERNAGSDSDIDWRLRAVGCIPARLSGRGCVFHLHHPKGKPSPSSKKRFREKQAADAVWSKSGIAELGPTPGGGVTV